MKKTQDSIGICVETLKSPPPPPLPRIWAKKTVTESVTKREISEFWRQKRVDEEDHLLAAIKAAARIRARNLSVSFEDKSRKFCQVFKIIHSDRKIIHSHDVDSERVEQDLKLINNRKLN